MKELCPRMLDGKGMSGEWPTRVLDPIFKGKEDVRNCCAYTEIKLLENATKIVERVQGKRI